MFFHHIESDVFWMLCKGALWRLVKPLFMAFVVFSLIWSFGFKKYIYQRLFGIPSDEKLQISDNEIYIDLPPDYFRTAVIAGYNIKFKLLKQYRATGRVIYVDRYTNPLGRFYRDTDKDGGTRVYDEVVPQDITFIVGEWAYYPKIKGSHEYRAGGLDYNDEYTYRLYQQYYHLYDTHLTNIHTIAASSTIQKGLDILQAGDVATLEGYLIYWETPLKNGRIMNFKSAEFAGERHTKIKYGGISGVGLCKQLLLTKIVFDGFVFE